jgi:putative oxidoreductase
MKTFPYLTLHQSLTLLRVAVASIFLAHAVVRVFNGTIPRFAEYLDNKGLLIGLPLVWAITVFEIGGGLLLILNKVVRWLSLGFIVLLVVGIILIHASAGWFVGEHGVGGMEYSVVLMVALVVIAAAADSK